MMAKVFLIVAILASALWSAVIMGSPADRLAILGAVAVLPCFLMIVGLLKGARREQKAKPRYRS
jgi:uncharacterized membrane protein